MSTVKIPVDPGWYICYKSGSGRSVAYAQGFETQAQAQAKLDKLNIDTMHVVEVKGVGYGPNACRMA